MRVSDRAWLALGAGIVAYEAMCPHGETLSEGVDRYIDRHPVTTFATIGMIALHLANVLPHQIDLLHQVGAIKDRAKGIDR